MSNFFKKGAKSAGSMTSKAIKSAIGGLLTEVVSEIIKETGIAEEMKGKLVDLGVNAIKSSDIGVKDIQKNALKSLLKNEMKKMGM